jgi:AcrR family transcriptional regulator
MDATLRLYAKGDYSAVTMRAIAAELGCQSPSLYHHFKSKEEIFRALVREGSELLQRFYLAPAAADPLVRLKTRFQRYYAFSKAYPEYFALLFVDRTSVIKSVLNSRTWQSRDAFKLMLECIDTGIFPKTTDPLAAGQALWCAAHAPAVLGLRGSRLERARADALAERTISLAIEGIRAGFMSRQHKRRAPIACDTPSGSIAANVPRTQQ